MGYTGIRQSVSATKEMLIREYNYENETRKSEVLKTHSYGSEFWILLKVFDKRTSETIVTADVVVMSHKNGETVYKEMNVCIYPYYYNIPESWLSQLTHAHTSGTSFNEWLSATKEFIRRKGLEIVSGFIFEFNGKNYTTVEKYTNQSWLVKREDGQVFKIKTALIKERM